MQKTEKNSDLRSQQDEQKNKGHKTVKYNDCEMYTDCKSNPKVLYSFMDFTTSRAFLKSYGQITKQVKEEKTERDSQYATG